MSSNKVFFLHIFHFQVHSALVNIFHIPIISNSKRRKCYRPRRTYEHKYIWGKNKGEERVQICWGPIFLDFDRVQLQLRNSQRRDEERFTMFLAGRLSTGVFAVWGISIVYWISWMILLNCLLRLSFFYVHFFLSWISNSTYLNLLYTD